MGKTPDPSIRTYADVMMEQQLRKDEKDIRKEIIDKKAAGELTKEKPGKRQGHHQYLY